MRTGLITRYFLLIFIIFIGCNKNSNSNIEENAKKKILGNFKNNEIVTDAFLNLKLRDKRDTVCKKVFHQWELGNIENSKSIRDVPLDKNFFPCDEFYYRFVTNKGEITGSVYLFYTEDSLLYKIIILCADEEHADIVNEVFNLYKERYSKPYYSDSKKLVQINGQRMIDVKNDGTGITINYTDVELEKRDEEQTLKREKELKIKQTEKTKGDI